MTLESLAARIKKFFVATAVTVSAINIPLYAGTMTIHLRDGAGAAITTNAVVYGLVYGSRGPDGSATLQQTVDGSGDAAFTLDPTKDYTFVASAKDKGPLARTQMMSSSAPHFRGDTTTTESTIHLTQDLSGRAIIHLTVQHGTANSFIMANVHKNLTNSDVQVGGCAVDSLGSDCIMDLYNIPPADADTYDVGVFDPNLFDGAGGGVGNRINTTIAAGDTVNVTLDLANAFPPNVSSTGNLKPDANNAVVNLSLRKTGDANTVIPRTWIQIMTKDQNNNLFPNGGGQTDDSGIVQFRVGVGSYYVQTGFTCPDGNTCYDGIQPNPSNPADVTIVSGDLNTTVNKTMSVPAAPEGTGNLLVEVVKASDPSVKIPFSGINIGPDWSQWSTAGAPNCGTPNGTSNPGKTQKNAQANDGTVLLQKLTDGNYALQVWTQFAQGGTSFNGGADKTFNWGNGLRGCTDQIESSADDLRLTVNGTTVKVYDINGVDQSATYVDTSGANPKIRIPVVTSADNAAGLVHGTLTFPEANDALVSISLQGQCDQNGCPGNFTTVHAGGQTSVAYAIHVPPTTGGDPAQYYMQIQSAQYGAVQVNGGQNQVKFQTDSTDVLQNITMAKSGIVEGTLFNPDGTVFIPTDGQNNIQGFINVSGEHSWGNANVDRQGHFQVVSLLPGKYTIDGQVQGGTAILTGKRPVDTIVITAGATISHDVHLVNAEYVMPAWDLTNTPALINTSLPNRGIKGETYTVLTAKADTQFDGNALRHLLTDHDDKAAFEYIPTASNNNPCGPTWTGWCGQYLPDGYNADYYAVRQGSLDLIQEHNFYMYLVFLQKKEHVLVDPSKTSLPTINPQNITLKPERVSFNPDYTGSDFITIKGTVKAEQMFRAIDFEKMGGDFNNFLLYIPLITVANLDGSIRAIGLVTPAADKVGDEAPNPDAIDATVASGDFNAFKQLIAGWDWNFEIRGVPKAEKYLLSLTSPNYPALSKVISGQEDFTWPVDWDKDGSAGATIQGIVADAGATPIANAAVELRTRGVVKNVTTDATGAYKFEGLPLGSYKVTASAADHAPRAERTLISGVDPKTVDITLPASDATISGTVLKYASVSGAFLKVPAEGVDVLAYDGTFSANNPTKPNAVIETKTASDGTYTLAGILSPNVYKISLKLPGYFVETLSVTSDAGTNTGNDVLMRPKGLELKVKIAHDIADQKYVVSILNPNNFDSGDVWFNPASQAFDANTSTKISSRFAQQPDGSLVGEITDAEVGNVNQNLHLAALPADGSPIVASDYVFGPTVTARVDQPIGDVLVAADGDNEVNGAGATITVEAGSLLIGNDDSTSPSLGLASYDLSSLGGTPSNNGTLVGNGIQVLFSNTQADNGRTSNMCFPLDANLVEGGVNASQLGIYKQNASGGWDLVTDQVSYDPLSCGVEGAINIATTVNERPLVIKGAKAAMAAASTGKQTPLTMAAVKTSKEVKKNPRASATVASVFAVGLNASTSTAVATEYHQYNFPNPFNLKEKTVTIRNGSLSGIPPNIRGTYIVVAPTGSGNVDMKIRIYNVAGDMVREFKGTGSAGHYNYFEWDGKNTSGDDVASGVYFAVVDAPGAPKKKPIKMVVVK